MYQAIPEAFVEQEGLVLSACLLTPFVRPTTQSWEMGTHRHLEGAVCPLRAKCAGGTDQPACASRSSPNTQSAFALCSSVRWKG